MLEWLYHKAQFSAALQRNLELRAQALRRVLRCPGLWPSGELSEAEHAQHMQLALIRDRCREVRRNVDKLASAVAAQAAPLVEGCAPSRPNRSEPPRPSDPALLEGVEASGETLEMVEVLKTHGKTVDRLVQSITKAQAQADECMRLVARQLAEDWVPAGESGSITERRGESQR